ncbi:A24 family peptidase [Hephaestia mangrovi]|uniref:A24 family peptidase n=1 Tax=Hephaestia mangrovi TaxID=2873268 RepID=UPI001CA6F5CB|nr:prepilin peptidase [Hephaestia mangrovi]MBY8828200.1 prepilin peptidase [Hephaestia mangrovi]
MGWGILSIVLLVACGLLLVSAGIEDVRKREIANWKNAAIALLAPLWWWSCAMPLWPDVAIQIGVAAVVFAIFVGAFALGQMGGGDVKLIGAIALWLPFQALVWMLVAMSLIGGVLTVLLLIEHKWRRIETPIEVPYGVAIVAATLFALHEPILNRFG